MIYDYHIKDQAYAPIRFYDEAMDIAERLGCWSYYDTVIKLYARHRSLRIVATKLKRTPQSIRFMLNKIGVPRRPRGGANNVGAITVMKVCMHHGRTPYYVRGNRCQKCMLESNKRRWRSGKRKG